MKRLWVVALLSASVAADAGALPEAGRLGAYADPMRATVERCTVHQEIGPVEVPLSMEVSAFLLDHPDLAAWLVRRHRLAPYLIEMRGPGRSWADDGDGTSGFIDLVDRQAESRAYYTEGTHVSRIFPDIHAGAVILMELHPAAKEGCGARVSSSFDVYVKMRSRFLATMVKALKPFIQGVLIRKFTKAFAVTRQVGVLLAQDPDGMTREILSYPGLSAEDALAAGSLLSSLKSQPASCL